MGVVYEAYDRERKLQVALKTLRSPDPGLLYRFKREFRAIADLSHPNLVSLYELGADEGTWFFTMELVAGDTMLRYLRPEGARKAVATPSTNESSETAFDVTQATRATESGRQSGTGPELLAPHVAALAKYGELVRAERVLPVFRQLAEALGALHAHRIVHRDLKPSNVMVTPAGRVVLMDFGIIAEGTMAASPNDIAHVVGTPAYMAPEQARGEATPAADWYAFGSVLYLTLCGRYPFYGTQAQILATKAATAPLPPEHWATDIPEPLARLSTELLSPEPDDRPDGRQVLECLGVATHPGMTTPAPGEVFVGREDEVAILHRSFQRAQTGRAIALVEGASGIGKSSLVRHFFEELSQTPPAPVVLTGRCHERETLPYKGFDGVMDSLSELLRGIHKHELAELLPPEAALLGKLFPLLGWLSDPERSEAVASEGKQLRARAFATLYELLFRLGEKRAVIVAIDDLQWADRESLDLLSLLLAGRDRDARMLFLLSFRPEGGPFREVLREITRSMPPGRVQSILVGPMTEEEQEDLVRALVGGQVANMDVSGHFWADSEGNPLLLAELARFVRSTAQEDYPTRALTFEEALTTRIRALGSAAQALAEASLLSGEPTPLSVLAQAAGIAGTEREQALTSLRTENLLRVARHGADPWVDAFHDRVRETIVPLLGDRPARHRALAEAMEDWPAAPFEVLARHWLEAGDNDRAGNYFEQAAHASLGKLAFGRAIEFFEAALGAGATPGERILTGLGDAFAGSGQGPDAAEAYRQAANLTEGAARLRLEQLAAEQLLRSGRIQQGLTLLGQVLERLKLPMAHGEMRALFALAVQRMRLGMRGLSFVPTPASEIPDEELERLDLFFKASTALGIIDHIRGAVFHTRHLVHALDCGEPDRVCRAMTTEVIFRFSEGRGDVPAYIELADTVKRLASESSDPRVVAFATLGQGAQYFFTARWPEGLDTFTRAQAAFARLPGMRWEWVTAASLGTTSLVYMAGFNELARRQAELTETALGGDDAYARNSFLAEGHAWTSLRADMPDAAHRGADMAMQGWPEAPYFIANFRGHGARLAALLYEQRYEETAQLSRLMYTRMRRAMLTRLPVLAGTATLYHGITCAALSDSSGLARSSRRLRRTRLLPFRALAGVLDARRAWLGGKRERSVGLLRGAVDDLARVRFRIMGEPARYRLGRLTGGPEGHRLADEALERLADEGVKEPERLCEALMPWP